MARWARQMGGDLGDELGSELREMAESVAITGVIGLVVVPASSSMDGLPVDRLTVGSESSSTIITVSCSMPVPSELPSVQVVSQAMSMITV